MNIFDGYKNTKFEDLKNLVDITQRLIYPALQGNALLPGDFAECIYHVGSSHDMHSIIQSGLIPGGDRRYSSQL